MTTPNTDQLLHDELERQRNERTREGIRELIRKNPESFKSKIPTGVIHFAPDKLGDEK